MLTVLTVVHDAVLSEDAGILRGPEIWLGFARNDFSLMIRVPAGLTTKGHFNSVRPEGAAGAGRPGSGRFGQPTRVRDDRQRPRSTWSARCHDVSDASRDRVGLDQSSMEDQRFAFIGKSRQL